MPLHAAKLPRDIGARSTNMSNASLEIFVADFPNFKIMVNQSARRAALAN